MALFVLVMALFILVVRRPGWGSSVSPKRWMLWGGLVLPGVVVIPLIGYALFIGEGMLPLPGAAPVRIEVVARQWEWTFRYPEQGGVLTKNELHLPAGTPVDIIVTSEDVVHSFWVPRFAGKMDAVPGRVNRLRLQTDQVGRFEGVCSEFCGTGHTSMRFAVVVHPAQDFAAALAKVATQATTQKGTP